LNHLANQDHLIDTGSGWSMAGVNHINDKGGDRGLGQAGP
jgi:hypothetical protein